MHRCPLSMQRLLLPLFLLLIVCEEAGAAGPQEHLAALVPLRPPAFDLRVERVELLEAGVEYQELRAGDFNGDGFDDVITKRPDSDECLMSISRGDGRFTRIHWSGCDRNTVWRNSIAVDVNNDGYTDLVGPTEDSSRWLTLLSDGTHFTSYTSSEVLPAGTRIVSSIPCRVSSGVALSILTEGTSNDYFVYSTIFYGPILSRNYSAPNTFSRVGRPVSYLGRELQNARRLIEFRTLPISPEVGHSDVGIYLDKKLIDLLPTTKTGMWQQMIAGYFNNDSTLDVFTKLEGTQGIVFSYLMDDVASDRHYPAAPEIINTANQILSGDFDGDTRDEVLLAGSAENAFYLLYPEPTLPSGNSPGVCLGYTHRDKNPWGRTRTVCPPAHAFFEVTTENDSSAKPIGRFSGTCCPLPAENILTGERLYAETNCPEGHIVVGREDFSELDCPDCRGARLICERINSEEYRLGPVQPGTSWAAEGTSQAAAHVPSQKDFPISLRVGIGRLSRTRWDIGGCVGLPLGSLLVGVGSTCSEMRFRELVYSEVKNSTQMPRKVKMYAECDSLTDLDYPFSGCNEMQSSM